MHPTRLAHPVRFHWMTAEKASLWCGKTQVGNQRRRPHFSRPTTLWVPRPNPPSLPLPRFLLGTSGTLPQKGEKKEKGKGVGARARARARHSAQSDARRRGPDCLEIGSVSREVENSEFLPPPSPVSLY